MVVLYGTRNCGTVKKARHWLDEHGIAYRFHNFHASGQDEKRLVHWIEQVDWETLFNRRGTWRRRLPAQRNKLRAADGPSTWLAHPTLTKRPVLEGGEMPRVDFSVSDKAPI